MKWISLYFSYLFSCNEIYNTCQSYCMTVSKNNMWASHGLDRFCVRPYSKLGPEFQVRVDMICQKNLWIINECLKVWLHITAHMTVSWLAWIIKTSDSNVIIERRVQYQSNQTWDQSRERQVGNSSAIKCHDFSLFSYLMTAWSKLDFWYLTFKNSIINEKNTKKHHKRVVSLYVIKIHFLIYINFNFDFFDLHNTQRILKQFKTFAWVRVLSDLKILGFASYLYIW